MNLKVIGSNQTEVQVGLTKILFSYNTPVAAMMDDGSYIRTDKQWSRTTSKHINAWLNGATAKSVEQSILDSLAQ